MKRTSTIILTGVLAMAGCQDMGLEYNLPLDEAMDRPPYALVSAVMAPTDVADRQLIAEGRLWVPSGLPQSLAPDEVQPVGTSGGTTIYARSWDSPPYDELFAELRPRAPTDLPASGPAEETRFLAFAPVIGGGRPGPGADAGEEAAAH